MKFGMGEACLARNRYRGSDMPDLCQIGGFDGVELTGCFTCGNVGKDYLLASVGSKYYLV